MKFSCLTIVWCLHACACTCALSYEDGSMLVHASPLKHRDLSCWGFVVTEKVPSGAALQADDLALTRGRKVAILGDTCNSAGLTDVAMDADVMVHEATYLQQDVSFHIHLSAPAANGALLS